MSGYLTPRRTQSTTEEAVETPAPTTTSENSVANEALQCFPEMNAHQAADYSAVSPQSYNDDVALEPLAAALNTDLPHADRAQLMLDYRNHQLADVPLGPMYQMQSGQEGMPVIASGEDKGMQVPLYERLAGDEQMQTIMSQLSTRILNADANGEAIDITQLFADVQADAVELSGGEGNTADTNLQSLQAMATLANYYKFDEGQTPEDLGVSPELWSQIYWAGEALSGQTNPEAAIMNHGVSPANQGDGSNFTADRNFHFFSHAYLAATLDHEHGLSANDAEAISGFVGAQYELMDHSLSENHGNSGIKDILVNAEGARFGTSLMADPETTLPGQYDGPVPEDRSIGNIPYDHAAGAFPFDEDTRAVADEAQDLSKTNLVGHALSGVGSRLWNEGLGGIGDSISDLWR